MRVRSKAIRLNLLNSTHLTRPTRSPQLYPFCLLHSVQGPWVVLLPPFVAASCSLGTRSPGLLPASNRDLRMSYTRYKAVRPCVRLCRVQKWRNVCWTFRTCLIAIIPNTTFPVPTSIRSFRSRSSQEPCPECLRPRAALGQPRGRR